MTTVAPSGARSLVDLATDAGAFDALDGAVCDLVVRRAGLDDPVAALAVALLVKAVRLEHVCLELRGDGPAMVLGEWPELAPPSPEQLRDALVGAAGRIVEVVDEGGDVDPLGSAPVVLSGPRAYLRRYALLEQDVARRLRDASVDTAEPEGLDAALHARTDALDAAQRAAVRLALSSRVSVIAGGPGTGKTTTIAALLEVAGALREPHLVALAAPTGKAADRLQEAIRANPSHGGGAEVRARTVHALVGVGRDGRGHRRRPLDADVVVVDEASMVSLPLLAQLLAATAPSTRVVLVGDPDQLASVEVGTVLADVVAAAHDGAAVRVATLTTSHRFAEASAVPELAAAVRSGDATAVERLLGSRDGLSLAAKGRERAALVAAQADRAERVVTAARHGDGALALAALRSTGLLCGTRRGDGSVAWWTQQVEAALLGRGLLRRRDPDYVGRPLLVTRNDPVTGLANGSVGVIVADGARRVACFDEVTVPLDVVPAAETAWALTIHKSQGSEYDQVVVSLPEPENRVLTRELVYTAVTRARRGVAVVAPPGTLAAALARRVARASGLAVRLRPR